MRQEIWIRLSHSGDGGEREIERRLKQLAKQLDRLALEVLEVRQVQVKPAADD
jgi:hypothetical protein